MEPYRFDARLWLYDEDGGWVFATVPEDVSDDIADRTDGTRRGFGSVRVEVTVGGTTWRTSVFPSKQLGAYVLPVKKDVRVREDADVGDTVAFALELL